ncbi:NADH dehydrogenase [ubiquinone] 1 beta subcomplex subunit 4-like [Cebus imitator]|uniref:NADH dehydrogenase [ubiquinone] 1 beta subcomplex subunit 4-like n=1 Tax=Cebus imitator TaxID=2715852 RepID=UPI001897F504|nr:NADH dehydrogenase [ubiquinone] 1 beta subcomplex subunit 4-like [Cebus imitator]
MSFPKYKPSHFATLPQTLDPAEYDISLETRRAQVERLAIRARLKREYLLQYNDPHRRGLVVNPALVCWAYARANVYPNCRATPKTSLLGAVFGVGPLILWYYILKTDRDKKEKLIREGKLDRTFNLSY